MTATLEYIQKKFKEFNDLCFEGKLPLLPFKLSNARTFLGQITFRRDKNPDGTFRYYGFEFRISTKTDLPEAEVEDTILHEMIHYYILYNQLQDTSAHGEIFRRMMNDINRKFNRHISIMHMATKEEQDNDTEVREHIICVSRTRGNRYGITIVNKSRLFLLWDEIPKFRDVVETNWYVSADPFYNRYPRASSVKIYPISVQEIELHNKDFKRLVRTGNNIRIEK